ncbi:DEAD/DEAH box helicase family protein [uncultured Chloroflexus sp.]|uniref:type I restriction endonuclease subunit R n=1 Tax=uncultured Chloroflexus sp. TaxID=214040 RepID=UPI00261933AB|nr:DEAD/DEAH box helicase family protein [uncultured Chloroflexus sp.]
MMMDISEHAFETYIVNHLVTTHGYLERRSAEHYDRALCLDWELTLSFITATQPDTWRDLAKQHGAQAVEKFKRRLVREIERRGTLDVLRRGVKDSGCYFQMAYFAPATSLNPAHQELYGKNILSVIRQCRYSAVETKDALDLVLFLNGLPLFTLELKNKLTGQTVANAREQYAKDRDPKNEPLLQFRRCLAHFAVDDDEVWLTTKLEGARTRFLPFNRGYNGGAGNPPNPNGYASAYLWEDLFAPASVLELVGSFVHVENGDQPARLIFPRYHQRDAVRKLVAHARQHGAGHHYLIQHSAGSGKSNTIAWLAHRLASLHNDQNQRVFSSVIVITDRRVLDRQLQNTVRQFEQVPGVVNVIDQDSAQLAEALNRGADIIVSTLQKFPFVLDRVETLHATSLRHFAVIVDEAHSSQTSEANKRLKEVLRAESLEEAEQLDGAAEAGEPSGEDLINQSMAARGRQPNLSFFAFTATPKQKTLELFGIEQPDGAFRPFHLYTMRQAIEEGFILDVLQNYTTYETYFNLLKKAADDPHVEKSQAFSLLKRYVSLHQFTIAQKTAIMVEHFWETTRHKIPDAHGVGQAKAMVVTASRLHAVLYKQAFDDYLKKRDYPIRALVAFSGVVQYHGLDYTEASMNGFPERQTAEQFKKPEYRFLIVAEKFQTGFDQPLLHTMYVDKKLAGVHAVQTLSRLNRVHPGKTDTMVLDFVNRAEDIERAFAPYYETTLLSTASDPNKLYDLQAELEQFNLYTPEQVAEIAELFLRKGEKAPKLQPLLRAVVDRYQYIAAVEERIRFKHLLRSYINLYAFLSQVMTFRDANLEQLYLFARLLLRALPPERERAPLAVGELVDLESYRVQQTFSGRIGLRTGESLAPLSDLGGDVLTDPEKAALSQIIQEINERFGTEFTEADRVFFAELKARLTANDALQTSARINPPESVRLLHDTLFDRVLQTMIESNFEMFRRINDDESFAQAIREKIFKIVYQELQQQYQRR